MLVFPPCGRTWWILLLKIDYMLGQCVFVIFLSLYVIRHFRGTCSSIKMLKGHMAQVSLGTPAPNKRNYIPPSEQTTKVSFISIQRRRHSWQNTSEFTMTVRVWIWKHLTLKSLILFRANSATGIRSLICHSSNLCVFFRIAFPAQLCWSSSSSFPHRLSDSM